MFIVTCPRTGHVRKFPNGRAAKRWLKEQAAVYVPTVEEDTMAFAGLSLQRNAQGEIVKARNPGAGYAGGSKSAADGKCIKGKLVRKQEGVVNRWDAPTASAPQYERRVKNRAPIKPDVLLLGDSPVRKNLKDQFPS